MESLSETRKNKEQRKNIYSTVSVILEIKHTSKIYSMYHGISAIYSIKNRIDTEFFCHFPTFCDKKVFY